MQLEVAEKKQKAEEAKRKEEQARQAAAEAEAHSGWTMRDVDAKLEEPKKEEKKDGQREEEEAEDEVEDDDDDDVDEEEEGEEDLLRDEPLASASVSSALELAKRRAYIGAASSSATAQPSFTLTSYDALGRELSAKEKFRLLSHAFHGQGAGISKRDKRVRRLNKEVGVLSRVREKAAAEDSIAKQRQQQRRTGQAYLVLDGGNKSGQRQMATAAMSSSEAAAALVKREGPASETGAGSRKRVKR